MAKVKKIQAVTVSPVALLVLGMHRSGTSAFTRVLNLHGVALGENLMPAGPDNPSGFWEHADVVAVHERLLAALERTWDDPRPLPDNWLASAAAQTAFDALVAIVQRDFAGVSLWAVKDPRLCRLLPLLPLLVRVRVVPMRLSMLLLLLVLRAAWRLRFEVPPWPARSARGPAASVAALRRPLRLLRVALLGAVGALRRSTRASRR